MAQQHSFDELKIIDLSQFAMDLYTFGSEFQCKTFKDLNFVGTDEYELYGSVVRFLKQVGSSPSEDLVKKAAHIVRTLASEVKAEAKAEAVWLAIRVQPVTTLFTVPQWHTDGYYFRTQHPSYKTVFTLKGQQTRFAAICDKQRFALLELQEDSVANRRKLDSIVEEFDPFTSPYEAASFRVGDNNVIAHSEPDILDGPRILVSIVPGPYRYLKRYRKDSESAF